MQIARDKDGSLNFFTKEPYRYILGQYTSHEKHVWLCDDYNVCHTPLPENMFPKLTWEDEPIEVELIPMSFIKEVNNLTDAICGTELGRPEGKEKGDVLVSMKKVNEILSNYVGGKII